MTKPLDGVRILDWTIWQQGPVSTMMLADLGAEVIKIEERTGGDPGRGVLSIAGALVGATSGPNFYFEANNRHKKSITLDLKNPEAIEIVHKLAAKSDVFVQNFRKGVAEKLGIGYDALSKHNPKLIYASATGYGPIGPDSAEPSFDYMGLARSGIMTAVGEPDMEPLGIAGGIADQMGAIMLAYGVMAALISRDKHGIGQQVDISHLGSMTALQGLNVACKTILGKEFVVGPGGKGSNQSVAAGKAGASVEFITKIGNDDYGKMALNTYRETNVGIKNVFESKNRMRFFR